MIKEREYLVEKILDARKISPKKFEYLIRWDGYSSEHDTWEPQHNLNCEKLMKDFWKTRKEEDFSNTHTDRLENVESEYEKQRRERIQQNNEFLKKLGLSSSLLAEFAPEPKSKRILKKKTSPDTNVRRSVRSYKTRQKTQDSEEFSETFWDKHLEVSEKILHSRVYNSGRKIYDSISGVTCHQCRQKTIDEKSRCVNENFVATAPKHHFCRYCLLNRYGENLDDVLLDPNWVCPFCKGICNCSFCRIAKGRVPTGILSPFVRKQGFSSVSEYLLAKKKSDHHRDT